MRAHVVEKGECLTSIARRYGFADPKVIFHHPDNEALRKARPDMNVLYEGDVVAIPDPETKPFECDTEKTHPFKVKLPKKKLSIALLDGENAPMDGLPYVLVVGKRRYEGTTDEKGKIEHEVSATATHGTLSLCGGPATPIRIGALNPLRDCGDDGVTGVQSRLRNLGYDPGSVDADPGPKTRAALRQFQIDQGLEATGEPDYETLRKLELAHGV